LTVFRILILTFSLFALPCGGAVHAGRIQRNVRDGMQSASLFCHTVIGLSWSYYQPEKGLSAKPNATHFTTAANEIGSKLSVLYGKNVPKRYSSLFVKGWNSGMKKCFRSL